MRYFRPYLDKIGQLRPARLRGFLDQLSAGNKGTLAFSLPKVLWGMIRGFNQHEFRIYRPHRLPWRTLATYHSTIDNVRLIERLNPASHLYLLRDKGVFLRRFAHRAGREFIDLREVPAAGFGKFLHRHSRFVAKAYNLSMGTGIEVFEQSPPDEAVPELHARLLREEKFIVEEFITQHSALNRIYARSINSIRLYTLLTNGVAKVLFPPMIRFGSRGGRIDAQGELTLLLEPETGNYLAGAVDLLADFSAVHPDSGVAFAAITIPFIAEAQALVKAAALEMPEVRYIGWDVAITPTGPTLIEGNGAPNVSTLQLLLARTRSDQSGCRRQLAALR